MRVIENQDVQASQPTLLRTTTMTLSAASASHTSSAPLPTPTVENEFDILLPTEKAYAAALRDWTQTHRTGAILLLKNKENWEGHRVVAKATRSTTKPSASFPQHRVLGIETPLLELDVPSDGSCLFYSIALSYLLPVIKDKTAFEHRYARLFGKEGLAEEAPLRLQQLLLNYDGWIAFIEQHVVELEVLVDTRFRTRLVDYMRSRETQFSQAEYQEEKSFESAMSRMAQAKTWGDHRELEAASQYLERQIVVYEKPAGQLVERAHYSRERYPTQPLYLIRTSTRPDTAKEVLNHYHYLIEPSHLPLNRASLMMVAEEEEKMETVCVSIDPHSSLGQLLQPITAETVASLDNSLLRKEAFALMSGTLPLTGHFDSATSLTASTSRSSQRIVAHEDVLDMVFRLLLMQINQLVPEAAPTCFIIYAHDAEGRSKEWTDWLESHLTLAGIHLKTDRDVSKQSLPEAMAEAEAKKDFHALIESIGRGTQSDIQHFIWPGLLWHGIHTPLDYLLVCVSKALYQKYEDSRLGKQQPVAVVYQELQALQQRQQSGSAYAQRTVLFFTERALPKLPDVLSEDAVWYSAGDRSASRNQLLSMLIHRFYSAWKVEAPDAYQHLQRLTQRFKLFQQRYGQEDVTLSSWAQRIPLEDLQSQLQQQIDLHHGLGRAQRYRPQAWLPSLQGFWKEWLALIPEADVMRLPSVPLPLALAQVRQEIEEFSPRSTAFLQVRNTYLREVLTQCRYLTISGLAHGVLRLELDQLYVALTVDTTVDFERQQFHRARIHEFDHDVSKTNFLPVALEEEVYRALKSLYPREQAQKIPLTYERLKHVIHSAYLTPATAETLTNLIEHSLMHFYQRATVQIASAQTKREHITIDEVYARTAQHLVVLGDAGAGKTTLGRWLSTRMAKALLAGETELRVPRHEVDPTALPSTETVSLGEVRLPIFVPIWQYAQFRKNTQDAEQRGLWEFLHRTVGEKLADSDKMMHYYLKEGRALLIMDGLDEVPSADDRDAITRELHRFADEQQRHADEASQLASASSASALPPSPKSRNRLIVTCRLADNYTSTIDDSWPRVIIEGMSPHAIHQFYRHFFEAVFQQRNCPNAENLARDKAQALNLAMRRQPAVATLARRPRLAHVIGALFLRDERLPTTRAALYSELVQLMLTQWREKHQEALRAAGFEFNEAEILHTLASLAAYMQADVGRAISAERLKQHVVKVWATLRGVNATSPLLARQLDAFIGIIRQDVGLLSSHDHTHYSFLDASFQDYFAGCFLVSQLTRVVPLFLEHVQTLKWREPIRFALGYLSQKHPDALIDTFEALLAHDTSDTVMPTLTLLLLSTLEELVVQEAQTRNTLAHVLLNAFLKSYANRATLVFSEYREHLVLLAKRLCAFAGRERMEAHWLAALNATPAWTPAIAHCLARLGDTPSSVLRLIQKRFDLDDAAWGWSLTHLLQANVDPHKEKTMADFLAKNISGGKGYLKAPEKIMGALEQYPVTSPMPATTAADLYALNPDNRPWQWVFEYNYRQLAARLSVSAGRPLEVCEDVRENPEATATLLHSLSWRAIFTALCGGYLLSNSAEHIQHYHEMSAFLQLEDNLRNSYAVHFQHRWGEKDFVYDMAVYLDTMGARFKTTWQSHPQFTVTALLRPSSLSATLVDLLLSKAPLDELKVFGETHYVQLLRQGITKKNEATLSEVLLLKTALGQSSDVSRVLLQLPLDTRASVQQRLRQVAAPMQDVVCRAAFHLLPTLTPLLKTLAHEVWEQRSLLQAVLATTASQGAMPLDTLSLLPQLHPHNRAYALAEKMATLSVMTDDWVYSTAVIADTLQLKTGYTPHEIMEAVLLLSSTQQWGHPVPCYGWPMPALPPVITTDESVPLAFLLALERVPRQIGLIKEWLLGEILKPILADHSDALEEVILVAWFGNEFRASGKEGGTPQTILSYLQPAWADTPVHMLIQQFLTSAGQKPPYYHARLLCRLVTHLPEQAERLLERAFAITKTITNAHHRVQVLELIGREARLWLNPKKESPALAERAFDEARQTAAHIDSPLNRCRALGRLVCAVALPARESVLEEVLAVATLIDNDYERAETLRLLQPVLRLFQNVHPQIMQVIKTLKNPRWQALAQGHFGEVLQYHLSAHAESLDSDYHASAGSPFKTPTSPASSTPRHGIELEQKRTISKFTLPAMLDVWVPLLLVAQLRDVLGDAISSTPEAAWRRLALAPSQEALIALQQSAESRQLLLDQTAALALDSLLKLDAPWAEKLTALLPHLVLAHSEVLPLIATWQQATLSDWRAMIMVWLTEHGGLTAKRVPNLVSNMQSENDVLAFRAQHAFHHPTIVSESPTRVASLLGQGTIEAVFAAARRYGLTHPHVSVRLGWLTHSLSYDDTNMMTSWMDALESAPDSPQNKLIHGILSWVEYVSEPVWQLLCQRLSSTSVTLKETLIVICARLNRRQQLTKARWQQLREALPTMAIDTLTKTQFLLINPEALVKVLQELVAEHDLLHHPNPARLWQQALNSHTHTLAQLLADSAKLETHFSEIARNMYVNKDERGLWQKAVMPLENPKTLFQLMLLLNAMLRQNLREDNNHYALTLSSLLATVSALAERLPLAFNNILNPTLTPDAAALHDFTDNLVRATLKHNTYPGRAAAWRLLGVAGQFHDDMPKAFLAAIRDSETVFQAAMAALVQLNQFTDMTEVIDIALSKGLNAGSELIAYANIQLLDAVAGQEATPRALRERIQQGLSSFIRSERARRYVNFNHVNVQIPSMPRLDQVAHRALLSMANVQTLTDDEISPRLESQPPITLSEVAEGAALLQRAEQIWKTTPFELMSFSENLKNAAQVLERVLGAHHSMVIHLQASIEQLYESVTPVLDLLITLYKSDAALRKDLLAIPDELFNQQFKTTFSLFGESEDFPSKVVAFWQHTHSDKDAPAASLVHLHRLAIALIPAQKTEKLAGYYHNLACYYDATGESVSAKQAFLEALSRHKRASIHAEFGNFLLRQHQVEEAREQLMKARSLVDDSGLVFSQFEKMTLENTLQTLMAEQEEIKISPWTYATWLLFDLEHRSNNLAAAKVLARALGDKALSEDDTLTATLAGYAAVRCETWPHFEKLLPMIMSASLVRAGIVQALQQASRSTTRTQPSQESKGEASAHLTDEPNFTEKTLFGALDAAFQRTPFDPDDIKQHVAQLAHILQQTLGAEHPITHYCSQQGAQWDTIAYSALNTSLENVLNERTLLQGFDSSLSRALKRSSFCLVAISVEPWIKAFSTWLQQLVNEQTVVRTIILLSNSLLRFTANDDKRADIYHTLAYFSAVNGELENAQNAFSAALALNESSTTHALFANFLHQRGDMDQAKTHCLRARELTHDFNLVYRATFDRNTLDSELSEELSRLRILKIAPWTLATWVLFKITYEAGQLEEAKSLAEELRAKAIADHSEVTARLASAAISRWDKTGAEQFLLIMLDRARRPSRSDDELLSLSRIVTNTNFEALNEQQPPEIPPPLPQPDPGNASREAAPVTPATHLERNSNNIWARFFAPCLPPAHHQPAEEKVVAQQQEQQVESKDDAPRPTKCWIC